MIVPRMRLPDVQTNGRTNRQIGISCIAQILGIPEANVGENLKLGDKAREIRIVTCRMTKKALIGKGLETTTAGDLLNQL